jgi:hypothetical protein
MRPLRLIASTLGASALTAGVCLGLAGPAGASTTARASAPPSFQSCVAFRESTDGELSPDIYGFLPSTWAALGLAGSPYTASPGEQSAAFQQAYELWGASPWAPYDGC